MPQWRKLHHQIVDSFDVHDMPDDTHRLAWALLPLALDKEGRGIYNGSWLKARLFPLRDDLTSATCLGFLDWFASHDMLTVYSVDDRLFFVVPTWHDFQSTAKEADSRLPAPELLPTNSGATQEPLPTNSGAGRAQSRADQEADQEADQDVEAEAETAAVYSLLEHYGITNPALVELAQTCTLSDAEGWIAEANRARAQHAGFNAQGLVVARLRDGAPPPRAAPIPIDSRRFVSGEYAEFIEH